MKVFVSILIMFCLIFLTGCSLEQVSSSILESTLSSPNENLSQGVSVPVDEESFDVEGFVEFLNKSGYAMFFTEPINSEDDIKQMEPFLVMGPLTWALELYYDTHGIPKKEYGENYLFPIDELKMISKEMYGFEYDFLNTMKQSDYEGDYFSQVDGYFPRIWFFDSMPNGIIDTDTIKFQGNKAFVTIDVETFDFDRWTLEFTFLYIPKNKYCAYQLVGVEQVGENLMSGLVTPEIKFSDNSWYDTTENLNLRLGPGTEYDIIAVISKESSVMIVGRQDINNPWVFVETPMGGKGWVHEEYLIME